PTTSHYTLSLHDALPISRRIGFLDVAVKKRGELRLRQRPDLLRLHVAVLEQHERRYAADAVFLRDLLVFVDVDFRHLELARVLLDRKSTRLNSSHRTISY